MGLWPHGVVPGLQCSVHGVHGSLQGGPPSPCPRSSSGALPGTQSWSLLFPSHPAPCGQFFTALVWTRLPASVVCFQEMGPWCASGGAELSVLLPIWSSSQDSVWHSLFTKCGSCDCSGRVGADLFSSFPGPWFPFSFFLSFSPFFSFCHVCVCVRSCVCVCVYVFLGVYAFIGYLKQQATTHSWLISSTSWLAFTS